ncbi:MAG: DUF3788 family protein [Calditrichaceae bacterium]
MLNRYLGDMKIVWDSFIESLKEDYPLFSSEWRYYNEAKTWLIKITKK